MSGHTKEPWVVFPRNSEIYIGIGEETGDGIVDGGFGLWRDGPERKANATRIVECVNAMAGIDDPMAFMDEVRKKLEHISELRKRADDVVGFVDSPHMKALNTAVEISNDLLSRMGGTE